MNQKSQLFMILSAICLCAAGCGDDSSGNDQSADCGGIQCSDNQVCENDVCTDLVDEPDDDVCKKTENACKDDKTQVVCVKNKKPVVHKCDDLCIDGQCVSENSNLCKKTENTCLDDSTRIICEEGSEPDSENCAESLIRGVCRDGECMSSDPEIGAECEKDDCPEGAYCHYSSGSRGVCVAYQKIGDSCEEFECDPDLMCDDICKKMVFVGEKCGETEFCMGEFCNNGVCAKTSTLYGECNEASICPSQSVCIDDKCVPTKGACQSNNDCTGDSYCCLDNDACGSNLSVCVPYSDDNNHDPMCLFNTKPGIFEAAVQCVWSPEDYLQSDSVLNTVVSGKIHNKQGIEKPLLAFVTGNYSSQPFVIRIVEPENCQTIESIVISGSVFNAISLADFDGDGYMEMVTYDKGIAIFSWDEAQQKHVSKFIGETTSEYGYGTVSLHDLDDDGVHEIVSNSGQVYHADGTILSDKTLINMVSGGSSSPVVGDLDNDGYVEFISQHLVYRWQPASNGWTRIATLGVRDGQVQAAYADFGTPGTNASSFDFNQLDGRAEIVLSSNRKLEIWSIFAADGSLLSAPQSIMVYYFPNYQSWGYPQAVGDFNGDGKPEIGVASRSTFGVYDPKIPGNVVWEKPTHDSSGIAGASAFDFDGDGKIEIVYGDECFTRVYDGQTGEVLFSSYRNSGTVAEYPTIADVDDDGSTEIVITSDSGDLCGLSQDTSHRGVKCESDSDCYSGSCIGGLCRCTTDEQCNWQTVNDQLLKQYRCLAPLYGDTTGGNVCRAVRGEKHPGITILRDRLDRWVSSRTIWNQHAYNITNINEDGSIPKTSDWKSNFTDPKMNNYRQQVQGSTGAGVAPDITGRFTSGAKTCIVENGEVKMTAQVCNRGTKAVGSKMPAIFYKESVAPENILCVSYTDDMVPVKGCRAVSCAIQKDVADTLSGKKIILSVNDDGKGGKTTVECNEDNNTDEIIMEGCMIIN